MLDKCHVHYNCYSNAITCGDKVTRSEWKGTAETLLLTHDLHIPTEHITFILNPLIRLSCDLAHCSIPSLSSGTAVLCWSWYWRLGGGRRTRWGWIRHIRHMWQSKEREVCWAVLSPAVRHATSVRDLFSARAEIVLNLWIQKSSMFSSFIFLSTVQQLRAYQKGKLFKC